MMERYAIVVKDDGGVVLVSVWYSQEAANQIQKEFDYCKSGMFEGERLTAEVHPVLDYQQNGRELLGMAIARVVNK
jgi:hypothetical protein